MTTTVLIVLCSIFYTLIICEYIYRSRTRREDLLSDMIARIMPAKVEYNYGPHIFVLGVYFGERSRDLWLCFPFFMMRLHFKPR